MITPMREKRFYSQLSIYQLGQRTGIDPAKISLIERGFKIPRQDEKEKLAKALNCKITDLFPCQCGKGAECFGGSGHE